MQVSELPLKFPSHFWEREGKVYCHRFDKGQVSGNNYGNPVEVEVVEVHGKAEQVRLSNHDLLTNIVYVRVQVFSRDDVPNRWPGGWFDVCLKGRYRDENLLDEWSLM